MRLTILGGIFVFAACAERTELTPLPQVGQLSSSAVQAISSGVSVLVRTDQWTGTPLPLTEAIPLETTIDNGSERSLRLRYREFALVTDKARRRAALPPFDINGTSPVAVGTAAVQKSGAYPYACSRFFVAPYLGPYYSGFTPYPGPFAYDPLFYSTYYPAFARIPLPPGDMVQRALPEGVLEPAGRITGFLYFEGLESSNTVRFVVDLVDASTGTTFGSITIPFEVD
jgi:hypothetical protein